MELAESGYREEPEAVKVWGLAEESTAAICFPVLV